MFAEKTLMSTSNRPTLHLPAVSKPLRHCRRRPVRFATSPNPSISPDMAENVSALKAKYTDYTVWLKTSPRRQREPILTEELLKHSLRQMGINSQQAEQVVTNCRWYVYQFQKDLQNDIEQEKDSTATIDTSDEEQRQKQTFRRKKLVSIKSDPSNRTTTTTTTTMTTTNANNKEILSSNLTRSTMRRRYPILPSIQISDSSSSSSRHRRVDFDDEKSRNHSPRSNGSKRNLFVKLPSLASDSLSTFSSENRSIEFDYLSTRRRGLVAVQTRSILRKQTSSSSSAGSTEGNLSKPSRARLFSPSSPLNDEIPLGTRSQRLFGGSECFAQIMNELEEQQNSSS